MQRKMFYDAKPNSFEKAKWLRNHTTKHEQELWQYLRNKKVMGVRVKRQHPIGSYIADFYCHAAKLVIEIDGTSHNSTDQRLYDEERTINFTILGLMVIRFSNDQVEHDIDQVVNQIAHRIKDRMESGINS
ncbi:MAG TPA: endonuclease domain-containing protein [Ohtaekwangia sp.]|nr:endonuclease domain-containing protein [Ohtaekwangia sp.]